MEPDEVKYLTETGIEVLLHFSKNIAILPLEEWRDSLDRAETLAPILDPTLYREYLYSDKAKIFRRVLDAAITLKLEVMAAQPFIRAELEKQKS